MTSIDARWPVVLVAGDANLDLVLRGDVHARFGQAEQYLTGADLVLGSSAGICASGLARLGVDVGLVARVGDDAFGDFMLERLRARGVDVSRVRTVPGGRTGSGSRLRASSPASTFPCSRMTAGCTRSR